MRCEWLRSKLKKEHAYRLEIDEHEITVEVLCQRLQSDPVKGLSAETAESNLMKYGENTLKPPKGLNPIYRFIVHNFQGADCVACVGVFLCITNYIIEEYSNMFSEPDIEKIYIGMTLSMFIVYVGTYSYIIELKAVRILEHLRSDMSNHSCLVTRAGKKHLLNNKELTVGDLVHLHCGDRIPADIRIIDTAMFQVDNSTLTGDSVPVISTVEPTDPNPLASRNLVLATGFAVAGKSTGIVIKVGDSTVIGHLERENSLLMRMYTPLIHRFNKIVLFYCAIGMCLSLTFTFLAMRLNYKFLDVSTTYIAIFIVVVPEKLLICLHTNHILAALQMKKHRCLVKHFEGIETLGTCSVICCGKSGIITETEMKVSHSWYGSDVIDTTTMTVEQISCEGFGILRRCMHLNTSEHLAPEADRGIRDDVLVRDELELALVQYLTALGSNQESRRVNEISFSSARKYQLSIHRVEYDPRFLLVAMGAPETILERCSTILLDGNELKLNKGIRNTVTAAIGEMGKTGEQILGFCELFLPSSGFPADYIFKNNSGVFPKSGFRFVGMISLHNPIRSSVPDSVKRCKEGKIKVVLLSADHPVTVEAVARSAGLIPKNGSIQDANYILENPMDDIKTGDRAVMATGEMMEEMSEAELKFILYNFNEIIFARIRPNQKALIVKYFQDDGEIVAVTGKTISDSPALKKANIGLAPLSSSDIARQSADIVLVDGNFSCIVAGIEAGRLVFENFKKSICFQMATNVPMLTPFCLYLLLKIPLPLGAVSLLCIDIGVDFLAAISLSYETAEPYLMKEAPPKTKDLLTKKMVLRSYFHIGVVQTCSGLLAYFTVLGSNGFLPMRLIGLRDEWMNEGNDDLEDSFGQEWSYELRKQVEATAHTVYFFAIAITQIANLISSRTSLNSLFRQKMNWALVIIIGVEVLLASVLVSINLGWLDQSLKLHEIRWQRILLILPFAVLILLYDEIRKWFIRHFPDGWTARELQYL